MKLVGIWSAWRESTQTPQVSVDIESEGAAETALLRMMKNRVDSEIYIAQSGQRMTITLVRKRLIQRSKR